MVAGSRLLVAGSLSSERFKPMEPDLDNDEFGYSCKMMCDLTGKLATGNLQPIGSAK
jgi:hypothetical protein